MTKPVARMTPDQLARTRTKAAERQRRYRRNLRIECFTAYGGECTCCGETEWAFLCIDHVNGGGRKERNKWASFGSIQLYRDLRRRGWPEGYQLLCANCNMAKEREGGCPHQRKGEA